MMKYERLTIEKITKDNVILHRNIYGDIVISQDVWDMFEKEHNQLCELEDKIENGDLVSIKSVSKFIEMAFASEPPCNYEIDGDDCVNVIETNTKEWCETHCDVKGVYTECWEQYLRAKLKELQE